MSKTKAECKLDSSKTYCGKKTAEQSTIIKFPLTRLSNSPLDHSGTVNPPDMDIKGIIDLFTKHTQIINRLNIFAANASACMASINTNMSSLENHYNKLRLKEVAIFDELSRKLAVLELPNGNISFYFKHFQRKKDGLAAQQPEAPQQQPTATTLFNENSDLMTLYTMLESALVETEFGKDQDCSSDKYFTLASDLRVEKHSFSIFLPARYATSNQPLPFIVACQEVTMKIGNLSGSAFNEDVFTYCEALMEDIFAAEEENCAAEVSNEQQ